MLVALNLRVLVPESYIISKTNHRDISYGDGRWIELDQDRIQWRALILTVLKFRVLLPELIN
jgi:hypothetical protein